MKDFFYTILYEPLFNFLLWIYHILPFKDLGIAIIILTFLIKLVLFWPSLQALRSQKSMQEMQPKIDALKKQYADDKEELGKQLMAVYKEHKVNPFSSCLPILIQLPVLWALFKVFFSGLHTDPGSSMIAADQLQYLYQPIRDIYMTTPIHHTFLGFVDLAAKHNIILAVLAGATQFAQTKMLSTKRATVRTSGSKDEDMTAALNKQMLYVFPALTVLFGYQFPAGVTLYWLSSTLFTWVQQLLFLREKNKWTTPDGATVEVLDTKPDVIDAKAEVKKK